MSAKRTDANQSDILKTLHQAHVATVDLSRVGRGVPDVLIAAWQRCQCCGARYRQNVLCELKTATGRLNAVQVDFHARWPVPIAVARSIEDALTIAGVTE